MQHIRSTTLRLDPVTSSLSHQDKVSELSAEKEDLNERLKAEEERRKHLLGDKNLVSTTAV